MSTDTIDFAEICAAFHALGDFCKAVPYGSGHINDTYAVYFNQGGTMVRYILQRINHDIFHDIPALMQNIERVTKHCREKLMRDRSADISRRCLTLIPTHTAASFHQDKVGNFWRLYIFVENAATYDVIQSVDQAYEAAKAFGTFQRLLMDLPASCLHETIPGFHDTPQRFESLQAAIAADVCDRVKTVGPEIAYANSQCDIVGRLTDLQAAGKLPERVTHNDTKLNNVMIDDVTNEGVCVIDLDTVMPGLALYDFGDMVRAAARRTPEDEMDLSRVGLAFEMFESLARGYLESTADFLTECEREHLAFSAQLMTFETGVRFLTDYLQGDLYFKIHRPQQNLDRCRVQFAMARSLSENMDRMDSCIDELRKEISRSGRMT